MLSLRRFMIPVLIGLALPIGMLALLGASAVSARPIGPLYTPIVNAPDAGGLSIPLLPAGTGLPVIDGACNDNQYGSAVTVTYTDASGVTGLIYLIHTASDLYVCVQGGPGIDKGRFFSVYLDPDNSRDSLAQSSDYGLKVMVSGSANSTWIGTGSGGYTGTMPADWNGAAAVNPASNGDAAEYRIDLGLAGGACGQTFGLAVYHHWVTGTGDDYGWPSKQFYDSPKTWEEVTAANQICDTGKIAYVYRHDTATAAGFKALLEGAGYTVQLVPQSTVAATNFSQFDLTIIADDTGELDHWGFPAVDVTPIITPYKPIIGLGEGGYAFFGEAASPIGWPNGWHGPMDKVLDTGRIASYYLSPNDLSAWLPGPFAIYAAPVNEVAIYSPTLPSTSTPIAWEPLTQPPDHTSLVLDGCYHLWGFSGGPASMNRNGRDLFLNAVHYMRYFQCAPPPLPRDCFTVVKTAQPSPPGPVSPGTTITYTLSYTMSNNDLCPRKEARLIDTVPDHTLFVPGSAGGVIPNIEGTLAWPLGIFTPGSTGSKSFAVRVLDTACREQRAITNTATVFYNGQTFTSNTTTHNVTCPPVIFPNDEPPYAEDEIEIYPYPIVNGRLTRLSVQVRSLSATTQTVTVTFMTSPNRFGIGLPFNALPVPGNPRVVTLGPHAVAEVVVYWTPASSGHYCIQVKVEGAGFAPIYTQRNLDVTENLQPGVEDVLPFKVANPTVTTATIQLIVDNTCPGWTAWVTPTTLLNVGPLSGDVRDAELHVVPPPGGLLGTACHIDVQGWIGDRLIGGIRKLDVPPVHLPPSHVPWLEKEITTIPNPPVIGQANQVCVELQNPLAFTRVVTITFSEAAFGAGIGFTPFATQTFTLPPNSISQYCVNWMPLDVASLHRCLLIELNQPGFRTQRSQLNVDLVRRPPTGWNPGSTAVPFVVGNPFSYPGEVDLTGILIGLNNWMPQFDPPPPYQLGPGATQNVMLHLLPLMQRAERVRAPDAVNEASVSGDSVRVDVSLSVNGEPYSGFSVDFLPPLSVYLPIILK